MTAPDWRCQPADSPLSDRQSPDRRPADRHAARAEPETAAVPGPPAALAVSVSLSLSPHEWQVSAGRRFVAQTLAAWGLAELSATACLLVSEIVTNAIRRARQPVVLRLHHRDREVVAEIFDDDAELPRRVASGPWDESGRGLVIVDTLAADWGARPAGLGKVVWFSLLAEAAESLVAPGALPRPRTEVAARVSSA